MNYAIIESGTVVNIICLSDRNMAEFPAAVKLDGRPVAIGDTYTDGKFYHDGTEVLTQLETMQKELEDMKAALAELGVE